MDEDLAAQLARLSPSNRGKIGRVVALILNEIEHRSFEILTLRIPFQGGDMQEIERGLEPRKVA